MYLLTFTRLTCTPSIILRLVQVQYSSFHFTEVIILRLVTGITRTSRAERSSHGTPSPPLGPGEVENLIEILDKVLPHSVGSSQHTKFPRDQVVVQPPFWALLGSLDFDYAFLTFPDLPSISVPSHLFPAILQLFLKLTTALRPDLLRLQ